MKKELGIFLLLVALCAVTASINPKFLSPANLTNLANSVGMYGVFSLGLGLVIITGGIDLSVGSLCALCGVVLSMALTEWNLSWPVATVAVLLIPMALGWVHGTLVTRMKMQPFIVTLCGLLIYRGAARYIAHDTTKGFGGGEGFESLRSLASGKLFGVVPMPFVLLIVIGIILWVVLHR
jgi:ribose transport system permease protein